MMMARMKLTVKFCIRFLYTGLGLAATVYFIRSVSLIINVHDNYHFIYVFIAGGSDGHFYFSIEHHLLFLSRQPVEKYNAESRSILTEVDIFLKLGGDKSEVGTHLAHLIFKYPPGPCGGFHLGNFFCKQTEIATLWTNQHFSITNAVDKLDIVKKRVQVSEPEEEFYPSVTVCGGPK